MELVKLKTNQRISKKRKGNLLPQFQSSGFQSSGYKAYALRSDGRGTMVVLICDLLSP